MNFIKIFYKPEGFIEKAVKRPINASHFTVIGVISIIYMLILGNFRMPLNSITTISFSIVYAIIIVIGFMLLYSAVLYILGFLVDAKANYKELLISQIYFGIPVVILMSIPVLISRALLPMFENDIDMYMNTEIVIAVLNAAIYIYLLFLELKIVKTVQRISIKRALVTNLIMIGLLFMVLLDSNKKISNNIDPERREAERQQSVYASQMTEE